MKNVLKFGKYISILVIFIITFEGCAAIFSGSSQKVDFSSDPSGAKVYVNGNYMGVAPLQLKLEKKHSYTIEFRKEGYENKTVLITNSVGAGWIVLDALGGLIPIIIDAATGSWYSLDQDHVNAALEAQQVTTK